MDPLRLVQYLPGIQTNAEYDNGIRIHGCDNVHNWNVLAGLNREHKWSCDLFTTHKISATVFDVALNLEQGAISASLPSNVNGGLGYWNAYGMTEYKVLIP